MTADLLALLDQLDEAHAAGTADGEWRLQDNGTRHGPECRYEILDDEGSVAVCSDDNDATATTGADRTALIVAAVNALPKLTAALRAVLAYADELDGWRNNALSHAEISPAVSAERVAARARALAYQRATDGIRAAAALTPEQATP